jgi:hypothetical protein
MNDSDLNIRPISRTVVYFTVAAVVLRAEYQHSTKTSVQKQSAGFHVCPYGEGLRNEVI